MQLQFFLTATLLLPVYTFEFIMIYGMKVPYVKNIPLYKKYATTFNFTMKSPIFEQFLYFVILALLFLCVGCFKLTFQHNYNKTWITEFSQKIKDKNSSTFWRIGFFLMRYAHNLVLVALLLKGKSDLNSFQNLGFMIFFVLYTASEAVYRKTGILLIIFVAFFIAGQYYYSLSYKKHEINPTKNEFLRWLGLYSTKPDWKDEDDYYFRHTPYAFDWLVLLAAVIL
jgi:hypothetical protein